MHLILGLIGAVIAVAVLSALSDNGDGGDNVSDSPDQNIDQGYSLVNVPGAFGRTVQLRNDAADALANLQAAARADGIDAPLLQPTSGYRTVSSQQEIWDRNSSKYASPEEERMYVAQPGHSVHQTGRAVDLWLGEGTAQPSQADRLRQTDAWKWLNVNATNYGFYPYSVEPWHWEYGGPHLGDGDKVAAEVAQGVKDGYLS